MTSAGTSFLDGLDNLSNPDMSENYLIEQTKLADKKLEILQK